uniref:Putative secreted protein n=1 Tax=Ixodes ricinus TaxID=34613 RepID=A0A6B0U5G6_IXORI
MWWLMSRARALLCLVSSRRGSVCGCCLRQRSQQVVNNLFSSPFFLVDIELLLFACPCKQRRHHARFQPGMFRRKAEAL